MPSELVRSRRFGSDPATDEFSTPAGRNQDVHVIHGVYAHTVPLAGMTVRRARSELEERMNIAPDAIAVVNGNQVDEDTVLLQGQVLNFVKHAGEKGRG